jgi:hypothetical protein
LPLGSAREADAGPKKRLFGADTLISAYRAIATQRDYERYLKIIEEAWGPLLVSGVRPKSALKLRDAWAETPVAANMLVSIARMLINWGLSREFSESNPLAIPKLETGDGGASRGRLGPSILSTPTPPKASAVPFGWLATPASVKPMPSG